MAHDALRPRGPFNNHWFFSPKDGAGAGRPGTARRLTDPQHPLTTGSEVATEPAVEPFPPLCHGIPPSGSLGAVGGLLPLLLELLLQLADLGHHLGHVLALVL